MISIQVSGRCSCVANEKLGSSRVPSGMSHRKHAAVMELILSRKFTVNVVAWATAARSLRTSTLNHEIRDDTVKNETIIETLLRECDEVFYCIRCIFFKETDFHHALLGMDLGCFH